MLVLWTVLLLACAPGGQAAIIPDQVVSFMHILYSTIPVIRKGTDSRVGFGFRFGPHADAQVLFELGPQKRTEQLTQITTTTAGPDVDEFGFNVGKRHSDPLHGADALPELEHNHVQGRSFRWGASSQDAGHGISAEKGGQGGEWLSRWRAAWSGATPSAAPSAAPSVAPAEAAVNSRRTGRGMRIALAPAVSTPPLTPLPTAAPQRKQRTTRGPRIALQRADPTNPTRASSLPTPYAHLRDAMALLSARTPAPRPSTTPPLPRQPRQPRQGAILRAIRQLWEAGARAANYG